MEKVTFTDTYETRSQMKPTVITTFVSAIYVTEKEKKNPLKNQQRNQREQK